MRYESKFGVAIPIGSWHPFLPHALASLENQSASLEVAVLDASDDPRVRDAIDHSGLNIVYRRHGQDAGQSAAIDEGWRNTTAPYIFWLNADDRLLPGALEFVLDKFNAETAPDVVFGESEFIDENDQVVGRHGQVEPVTDLLLRSNTISQPSCFTRRASIEDIGGINTALHFVMDWDLWVRLYRQGAKFQYVDKALSAVYMGAGTKTGLVSSRRMREVYALASANAGTWSAVKSTVSLYLETLRRRWAD